MKNKGSENVAFGAFGNLKALVFASILVAISVTGKLFSFNIGEALRIGYENLPVILSGLVFGPALGFTVGIASDLCGCLAVGYSVNPIITLGMGALGLTSGIISGMFKYNFSTLSIIVSDVLAHTLGSVIIKTIGIALYYGAENGILALFASRAINYLVIAVFENAILILLFTNAHIKKEFLKLRR